MSKELKNTRQSNRTERQPFFAIAMAVGLTCLLPMPVCGKDHDDKDRDKKEGEKSQKHSGKGASPVARVVQAAPGGAPHGEKQHNHSNKADSAPQRPVIVSPAPRNTFQQSNRAVVNPQPAALQRAQGGTRYLQNQRIENPIQFTSPQGSRSNRYGGRWVEANTHSDWDRSREHYWNNRHYRWYDGGWLIVVSGNTREYSNSDSLASEVQQRLATRGYYNGEVDGDIGPASRRAIARYQDDHGLRPTGNINDDLLRSLRLE